MNQGVTVKVPGKVMIAGEYGVLRGGGAAACTISHALTVHFDPCPNKKLEVESDLWDHPQYVSANSPESSEPLLNCVRFCAEKYNVWNGRIRVSSKLDLHHGVGSSSALRLGTLLAFATYASQKTPSATDRWDLAREGYILQQKAQSFASGYDLATQNLGGLVVVRPLVQPEFWPGSLTRISSVTDSLNRQIAAFVGGRGAPTGPVVSDTMEWADRSGKWDAILSVNEALIERVIRWLTGELADQEVFSVCREHRMIFADSPHFPRTLINEILKIDGCDESWSFKTTGAGGEDALLMLGNWQPIACELSKLGWTPAPFQFRNGGAAISLRKGAYS